LAARYIDIYGIIGYNVLFCKMFFFLRYKEAIMVPLSVRDRRCFGLTGSGWMLAGGVFAERHFGQKGVERLGASTGLEALALARDLGYRLLGAKDLASMINESGQACLNAMPCPEKDTIIIFLGDIFVYQGCRYALVARKSPTGWHRDYKLLDRSWEKKYGIAIEVPER
jgi:hypothetical protein